MKYIQFDYDNKTLIIFITSIIWAINFRTTFKNIDSHMDSGSYYSLKFDPFIMLIKNILSCFFFVGSYYEMKLNKLTEKNQKEIIKTTRGSIIIFQVQKTNTQSDDSFDTILYNQLNNSKKKIIFFLKNASIILIVYFIEDLYFMIANNHIMDRLICPIRNLGFLITLLIFSPLLIKKTWTLYRHQFVPLIIIFIFSISIIVFNILVVDRFNKIFNINFLLYLLSFILMGLEMVLIKYLVDSQFISIFLILGIKGVIGTIVFLIINLSSHKIYFFKFFDRILNFEYDEMYEDFDIFPKILYVISLLILQYLKIIVINRFTENHILSVVMITDIIYFPFYIMEKFLIQQFPITTMSTFFINSLLGFINAFLMLIFNEILECKFCKLNYNIKKNINKRQADDIASSQRNSVIRLSENS